MNRSEPDLLHRLAEKRAFLRKAPRLLEKKTLIVEAAVNVFARKGYPQGRVSDIAREAGISYGLVYKYFKNKDHLQIS